MTVRVGFQGEAGAFSEEAALGLFGDGTPCVGLHTFDDLVDAVDNESVDAGLIPCENVIYGSIARTYDLLALHPRVRIVDETVHPIVQALIGLPGASLEGITRVSSHPVAIEQCRTFLRGLSGVRVDVAEDTAGAVRTVIERGDPHEAAIGPALAAQRYGGQVLRPSVHDDPENATRFFAIERDGKPRRKLGRACIAMELPHRAGSLYEALGAIARNGLNLRSLVARPTRARAFEYTFYVELDCGSESDLAALLDELPGETRSLGWY